MAKVTFYGTPSCPYCKPARTYLRRRRIKFEDVDITDDSKNREALIDLTGQMIVPTIKIMDTIILGFDTDKIDAALKKLKEVAE
jgi:glutaredoxin 3